MTFTGVALTVWVAWALWEMLRWYIRDRKPKREQTWTRKPEQTPIQYGIPKMNEDRIERERR